MTSYDVEDVIDRFNLVPNILYNQSVLEDITSLVISLSSLKIAYQSREPPNFGQGYLVR